MITESFETATGRVSLSCSTAADGSFALHEPPETLAVRRHSLDPQPWTWLDQVHGSELVHVEGPGQHAGAIADGALTFTTESPISVLTADCAPVALIGSSGLAVLHCGWRGVASGILDRAAAIFAKHGSTPLHTVIGPCIHPRQYEFGFEDLRSLSGLFGSAVVGETSSGAPALNMLALVDAACERAGWPTASPLGGVSQCTSNQAFFSHRTRGDSGRQTMVGRIDDV